MIVIAAGGDGRRMGGDKPLRLLNGQRLIDRMVEWAKGHSDAVALAVRAGGDDWGTGLPLMTDAYDGIGPISALSSAMHGAQILRRKTVLLLGCDMPFLPDNLVLRLQASITGHGAALPTSAGRLHPMAALWRCDPDGIDTWIAGGGQSLWRYAHHAGMVEVRWSETPDPFFNINDPRGLETAEERLRTA
ncbi:MAG: NTP transferase domain-containing protein [Sphingopyxis sp.]|nr:NTP transferase domain-containing protein [Sphingopyxis sp.]